jgi:hypothetical protein
LLFGRAEAESHKAREREGRIMRKEPFSVRILVADGDPEGIRIVEQPNWSGTGIVFPRLRWSDARERTEFDAAGVYLLVGESADGGLPTIAIGGGDPLR